MKIVFLDAKTIGDDIDMTGLKELGELELFDLSTLQQAKERTKDADIVITNKVSINQETIGDAPKIKRVCVTATGTNILDKD